MHVHAFPFNPLFNHPDKVEVPASNHLGLVGRVLAEDVELSDATLFEGTVLTQKDVDAIAKNVKPFLYMAVSSQSRWLWKKAMSMQC